jgi:hypothetical protein
MERVTVRVAGRPYILAQGQDPAEVKARITKAARNGGDFVTVTVLGNRSLDILVTAGLSLTFESETVAFDPQDDGNLDAPFLVPHVDDYAFDHAISQ